MMRRLVALLVLSSVIIFAGCAAMKKLDPPSIEYVKADVQFEQVLGDRIADWIKSDSDLTPTEKDALDLALQAWRAMVGKAAAANGLDR